jgi:SAM-dependent methyltransferase
VKSLAIITPVHAAGAPYLRACYESLRAQTSDDWRWYILTNNGGTVDDDIAADGRVCVTDGRAISDLKPGVGSYKGFLCEASIEPFILELDCDDLLEPTAVEKVLQAFAQDPAVGFVYSDFAEFRELTSNFWDQSWPGYPYGAQYGWESYRVEYKGHTLQAMRAPAATPQNVRLVDWAPNHLRAWSRSAYELVGGHNRDMQVGDDHDLIVRLLLAGVKFHHIPECLYFYRVHALNTVGTRNAEIRDATWGVYNRTIWALAEKFADDNKLARIDLCGGHDCPPGYTPLDKVFGHDLEGPWPLETQSVGLIRAHDAAEHLRDPVHTMNEAARVLAPGGFLMISVPSTDGRGAFCDPTHVSFWNELSFRYYTEARFAKYVPDFQGKFQLAKLITWFPSAWHKENNMPYCEAHLIRLGEGYKPYGASF